MLQLKRDVIRPTGSVLVTGAEGFVGKHLISRLARRCDLDVRAMVRIGRAAGLPNLPNIHWLEGDLSDKQFLRAGLTDVDILVHLAFASYWKRDQHISATSSLGLEARHAGINRIVLCSTAIVVGATKAQMVREDTPCEPRTDYEITKLAIERTLAEEASGRCELVVLRPTAIFGPRGQNLRKLAEGLVNGRRAVNYLRSSLFGQRRMNLVCIDNVVSAVEFAMFRQQRNPHETFIVSDDDDAKNNYQEVERELFRHFGLRPYRLAPVPVPSVLLTFLLWLKGRSSVNSNRVYDGTRLTEAGFKKSVSLAEGLEKFACWFQGICEAPVR